MLPIREHTNAVRRVGCSVAQGKKSKKGRLTLQNLAYPADEAAFAASGIFGTFEAAKAGQTHMMTVCEGKGDKSADLLVDVFLNGELLVDQKFADVRARADVPGGPFGG
jgi:hypothetical protein